MGLLPSFLIVGAMKCGTSTLQAQLSLQRGIFMSNPKEPNFFSDDDVYSRGKEFYEGLFADAPADALCGEASTHYTKLPTYPMTLPRMREMLDQPKIIYLIRDPIERAISHYVHEWTAGAISESIGTALRTQSTLVEYGRYAFQIEPFVKTFGRDAIMIATMEEMISAPHAFLERIGLFLGCAAPLTWHEHRGHENASKERIRRFPLHELLIDSRLATSLRRRFLPKRLRTFVAESRKIRTRPEISQSDRERLEQVYLGDYADLQRLFPGAPELAIAYPFLRD